MFPVLPTPNLPKNQKVGETGIHQHHTVQLESCSTEDALSTDGLGVGRYSKFYRM